MKETKQNIINHFFIPFFLVFNMNQQTRIEKDITMFEENITHIKKNQSSLLSDPRANMAIDYYNDAKFYLEKNDLFTAFGCINYGHGLLDALIKFDTLPK